MTFDKMRIFYNAIFGAIGGLLSWFPASLLLGFGTQEVLLVFLKDAVLGGLVGVCIGAALGAVDGLTLRRSLRRAILGAILGGCIGGPAGTVGLLFGEIIFSLAGGGVLPRSLGWAIFGLLVGTSEGLISRSLGKLSYGTIGGLLGGLIGGSFYERFALLLRDVTHDRDLAMSLGAAIGFLIVGACIGSLIGLVEIVMRRAWLRFKSGPLEGRTVTLPQKVNRLGRSDGCQVVLPGDPGVLPEHAVIRDDGRGFVIEPRPDGPVTVNKQPVPQSQRLQHGDLIQISRTQMVFHTESAPG